MSIYRGSRYEDVEQEIYSDASRGVVRSLERRPIGNYHEYGYLEHTTIEGDRLDLLAGMYYGQPLLWWVIADANKATIFDPQNLIPFTVLRIPRVFD